MKTLFGLLLFFVTQSSWGVTCTPSGSCSLVHASSGCRIESGASCTIVANGVCKIITNIVPGTAIFVSAQESNAADWQSWVNNWSAGAKSDCGCTFNGTPVAHGASITAYQSTSVPYGSSCVSQSRTCNAGVLSGSYPASSCTVQPGANCAAVDGVAVNHGNSRAFYLRACEDAGNSCTSQTRTCTNGTLSGSYSNASCTVTAGANCSLDGQSVASGSGRYFYNTTSVPYGQDCNTGTYRLYRNCNNGVFDGSASFNRASCSVGSPSNCSKDGVNVAHGASRTFYQAASASPCTGQSQTCNNGSFSPNTYQYANCTAGCPAQTLSWSGSGPGGSATCSAYFPASANGASVTKSAEADPNPDHYGSATYACSSGSWSKTSSSCGLMCFVAGTQVSMANGEFKNIEDVKIGDLLKTYDESTGAQTISPVTRALHHKAKLQPLFTFHLSSGKKVTSNDVHPFYVANFKRYIPAYRIHEVWRPGDDLRFLAADGTEVAILHIERREEEVRTYNLHVKSQYDNVGMDSRFNHNYYAEGVLVHNVKADSGPGSGSCFVAGTSITMADGSTRTIESLMVGELVKTFDEVTGEFTISPVKSVYHHEKKLEVLFTFSLSDGSSFTSNDLHPIFDRASNSYPKAADLFERWSRGETVRLENQKGEEVTVSSVVRSHAFTGLYNLHVHSPYDQGMVDSEFGHNYFANGVRVHNAAVAKY